MSMPSLHELLDLCQVEHAADWQHLPGETPGKWLLAAIVNAGDKRGPSLSALHHSHRAVYAPDPRLGLAWGMPGDDVDEPLEVEWKPSHAESVRRRFAHVLLNGAIIWQVRFAQVNFGAGRDGVVAWAQTEYVDRLTPGEPYPSAGAWVTTWDAGFAALLNKLAENDEASSNAALVEGHPLD